MEKKVFAWKNRYLVQYIAFFIYFFMCIIKLKYKNSSDGIY